MSKSLEQKRREAQERQARYDNLSLEEKLARALHNSGGRKTKEVRRLEAQIKKEAA